MPQSGSFFVTLMVAPPSDMDHDLHRIFSDTCQETQSCINARPTQTARRNEIVRDLVTHMYVVNSKPDKSCTIVAKSLVKKYSFMRDAGKIVSGYATVTQSLLNHYHYNL